VEKRGYRKKKKTRQKLGSTETKKTKGAGKLYHGPGEKDTRETPIVGLPAKTTVQQKKVATVTRITWGI